MVCSQAKFGELVLQLINGLAILLFMLAPVAEGRSMDTSSATITYTKGKAFVAPSQNGPWKPLKIGMYVNENQVIKTNKKSVITVGRIKKTHGFLFLSLSFT